MKYRIWKYGGVISYKDVEANSLEEANKEYTSPKGGWTITDAGMIVDHFTTKDLKRIDGSELFLRRRIKQEESFLDKGQLNKEGE